MPGKVPKIGTFSDWVGLFNEWRKEVGVDHDNIKAFKFDTLYGDKDEEIARGSGMFVKSKVRLAQEMGYR